jgi:putative DNA methylase
VRGHDDKSDDLRLIEDYLPIEAISAEASREKSVRKGHISTLHLWWARRPLVACRAAVYGALVPADRWVKDVALKSAPDDPAKAEKLKNGKKKGLNRRAAKDFVTKLCRYPKSNPSKPEDVRIKQETEMAILEAQRHILEAHAERLTAELAEGRKTGKLPAWVEEFQFAGERVTYDDILAGRAPRPRVLDMFAGGGSIPLEALRLGCEAYALDLNPVAHVIELCTLVYPQKYGKPDPNAPGMTGPRNANGQTTWGGLAAEVRYWGQWVLDRVRKEIGDLYPPIPDPKVWATPPEVEFDRQAGGWKVIKEGKLKRGVRLEAPAVPRALLSDDEADESDEEEADERVAGSDVALPPGFLQPVAYLWTRTVRCKNPACGATVPLVRQTWLCKKRGRYVALKMRAPKNARRVTFEVVESKTEKGLGFDPTGFSKAGNATCPFCGTVADNDYVKSEGRAGRIGTQPMAVVCTRPGRQGKVYFAADDLAAHLLPDEAAIQKRIGELCQRTGLTVPDEPIEINPRSMDVDRWGLTRFCDLFTPRQTLSLLMFSAAVRECVEALEREGVAGEKAKAAATALSMALDKVADLDCTLTQWKPDAELCVHAFARQALPMVWDFAEQVPHSGIGGSWQSQVSRTIEGWNHAWYASDRATLSRGSATALPWPDASFDAVVTDPPYYDNVSYANLSDFFYVWLKRSIGHLYPEHFAAVLTPKKSEVIAAFYRHNDSKEKARVAYEAMMAQSLAEAHRVLKPGGALVVVYAHKTTLGWSTLVEAFRRAGFTITEAWPLDTEMKARLLAMDNAALASSIFLVGRKRTESADVGNYEEHVQPELEQIVRERVETLWDLGIAGADLVIACVGAGLRAFTRYERVEYANGEEVPAEKFLAEVEGVVLDTILQRLSKAVGGNGEQTSLAGVDPATRFYVLWRYTYRSAELEAGEAIVFANGTHVELDGQAGLSFGARALLEKKKGKYRLRDYAERGEDERLGVPRENGEAAPVIDALHRTLWLMEHRPRELAKFLRDANPNREQMRLVAQALAGPALKGSELADVSPTEELSALGKLLANWRSVIEDNVFSTEERSDRKRGQKRMFE